jgi:membrane protein implicated in regulation of membrane protease activity
VESVINGIAIETIYLYVLIGCTALAFVLLLFGDIFQMDGPLDPILFVPWIAFTSLLGFIGETFNLGNSLTILIVSGLISTMIVFLLNVYVFIPIKNSEASIAVSEKDIEGRVATVITPIPVQGMGEIQIKSVTGSLNRPAAFYAPQEESILRGTEVLIIEVKGRVCYVVPYENDIKL